MTDPLIETVSRQRLASDPDLSAWVRANAGAGKTHVLVNRIIRLLLAGVQPDRILCLTFTKAAAAEMMERLFRELGRWVALDDVALAEKLTDIAGDKPDDPTLRRARRLFARALETPGGLKVQTIHGFCQGVLERFPAEAGVTPGFTILDDAQRDQLRDRAARQLLKDGSSDLQKAIDALAVDLGDWGFDRLVTLIAHNQSRIRKAIAERADSKFAFGFAADETVSSLWHSFIDDLDMPEVQRLAETLSAAGGNPQRFTKGLANWLTDPGIARIPFLLDGFLKSDGNPRSLTGRGGVFTAPLAKAHPDLLALYESLQSQALDQKRRANKLLALEKTGHFLTIASAWLAAYDHGKQALAALDYDDLISLTRRLLEKAHGAAWVLFKLDGGIDHILVDEAQDTSRDQWAIVEALLVEFTAGKGRAAERDDDLPDRSLFVVGDQKQSIYSFQGADPQAFADMATLLGGDLQAAKKDFEQIGLDLSFRSNQVVLDFVDQVFAPDSAAAVGVAGDAKLHHIARRAGAKGRVELWPLELPDPKEEPVSWSAPLDAKPSDAPPVRIARDIAAKVKGWIDSGRIMPATGRPVSAGDILILLKKRRPLGPHLIRALKQAGIPVAGADRLQLMDQIVVQDLLALGHFAVYPEDDLTLAALLKSPLCGLTEEDLFALAWDRPATLWQRLRDFDGHGEGDGVIAAARDFLTSVLAGADFDRPFDFYQHLLDGSGRERGRMAFHKRMGHEVDEPLDAFLDQALTYEQSGFPSLQGFLHWMDNSETELKRDLEQGGGEVRIMTAHGAKGLQAPIVILPDTCGKPGGGRNDPGLLDIESADGPRMIWEPRADDRFDLVDEARDAQAQAQLFEHRRLLYVALTRAEDELYIGGYLDGANAERVREKGPDPDSWYEAVAEAFDLMDCETIGDIMVLTGGDEEPARKAEDAAVDPAAPLPDWFDKALPPDPITVRPLTPSSGLVQSNGAALSPLLARQEGIETGGGSRFARGRLLHSLLEYLPDLSPPGREVAALRLIRYQAGHLDDGEADALWQEVAAVLNDKAFAPLFGTGSRAEVPVTGLVSINDQEVPVDGVIDRLLVTDDRVMLVDFKSNRPPPESVADVDPAYVRQMALYHGLLTKIYPGRHIETALLWTYKPCLMALPEAVLNGAFPPDFAPSRFGEAGPP